MKSFFDHDLREPHYDLPQFNEHFECKNQTVGFWDKELVSRKTLKDEN